MSAPSKDPLFLSFAEVKRLARHQWPAVLTGLGIDETFLRNRHGPCPVCGGTDRFRFDNKNGHGDHICNQCGAGDGFSLLAKVHNWTALDALQAVARYLGWINHGPLPPAQIAPATTASPSPATVEMMQERIRKTWRESFELEDGRVAAISISYLCARGLDGIWPFPLDIRLHPSLPYYHPGTNDKAALLGRYPALVALVKDVGGAVRGLHRTYLQPDGQGKLTLSTPGGEVLPPRKMLSLYPGSTAGCAIRLHQITDGKLAIAEGIETSLAVTKANPDWPCWSVIYAGNMERFELPYGVTAIAIMADNDSNQCGQRAMRALARRLFKLSPPPIITLKVPDKPDTDWLDVYTGEQ